MIISPYQALLKRIMEKYDCDFDTAVEIFNDTD